MHTQLNLKRQKKGCMRHNVKTANLIGWGVWDVLGCPDNKGGAMECDYSVSTAAVVHPRAPGMDR